MRIRLPDIEEQQKIIFEQSTKEAINQLNDNLNAPVLSGPTEIIGCEHSNKHLLRKHEGWEAPHPDLVGAYFRNFQDHFAEYNSDKKIANLLGLSSDRRIREFKQGIRKVPFDIWRKFLIITGRAPQDIIQVKCFISG
ncbi:MAG: hypothetical protein HRT37_19605 [Alteromonadaceae bacterium]|nr:hypothetical protein [Alteromonadaceae bacterium]